MIFGKSYADQHGILVVLSIGTAVAALGGPAVYVLLLTGHEGWYSRRPLRSGFERGRDGKRWA